MNKFAYILSGLLLTAGTSACNQDHEPDWTETAPIGIAATSSTITDGASIDPATKAMEITFDHPIALNAATTVTINGTAVEDVQVTGENRDKLLITFGDLRKGRKYVINIPARTVAGVDTKTFAPEMNISFTTGTVNVIDKSLLSKTLINANATAEAKAVYDLLVNNYGQKQLSGAMGGVAWETVYTDFIFEQSGKYPAIVGFDYIHLASSPSNWIDYGDITPVKSVWEAGSIPAMTWHWNVPTSKPAEEVIWTGDVAMPADWSGNIQLTDDEVKAKLAGVGEGSVITVKIKDVAAGAQGSVKNSSWGGLSSTTEYFDISGSSYSVTLTKEMADEVKAGGFIISGHDYTATEVIIATGGGSGNSFDASSTAFKASEVLVEGSWENQVATADVNKLAGYLKLLQDANIPVLWRPFHEAAGDYTWGAWFWWGNSGPEVTRQLWDWLYEKLTVEHGLNNLIWVWTVQTSDEGKLADISRLQAAYPGNDKVDIVGADLYVDSLTEQLDQFELVYNLVEGKKLVALSECGNLLEVDESFADGALWSYFMSWYEMEDGKPVVKEWNKNGEWSTILNNPIVLNRGDLKF